MTGETKLRGSCLCGAVEMTASVSKHTVGACHCRMCQRWGGGPFLSVECDVDFEGAGNIAVYDSSKWAERGFCRKCGSHLFYHLKGSEHYEIPVGLLDHDDGFVLDKQIFIEEKPPFYSFANETENLTGAEAFAQYEKPSS